MAYSKITAAKNGVSALNYLEGKGHNGNKKRNIYITGVNLLDDKSYAEQMDYYWQQSSDRCEVQVRRMIQSFSKRELNPAREEDILKAHEIGIATGKAVFGDRQFVVATQIDGKSGLIHNHIIGNNVDMFTLKGMKGDEYRHKRISEISDNTVKSFGVKLDYGKSHGRNYTQAERGKQKDNAYVWKDDLRKRIKASASESHDFDEFKEALAFRGVSVREGKHLTYTLEDTTAYEDFYGKAPKKAMKARPKSLGDEFTKENIIRYFPKQPATQENDLQDENSLLNVKTPYESNMPLQSVSEEETKETEEEKERRIKLFRMKQLFEDTLNFELDYSDYDDLQNEK